VKVLPIVGKDPESQRMEMIKKEEERLKVLIRRENQQRRVKEKASQRLNSNYLEDYDDDDENAVSLSALKKQHKQNIQDIKHQKAPIYSSDEDLSEEESRKRLMKAKRPAIGESDSDEAEVSRKKRAKISDSEEEDE